MADESSAPETDGAHRGSLADVMLRGPPVPVDEPAARGRGRFAYPTWAMALVSLFIAYHAVATIVHNTPRRSLTVELHRFLEKHAQMRNYLRATGNVQSWAMFAPNPHRSNLFMKVLVVDERGDRWDMALDIHGRRSYPYLFYDRMGKINRRIIDQRHYRRYFAAWVCREWERNHEGRAAQEVQFVRMWTNVPPPERVIEAADGDLGAMWFDPMSLPLGQEKEESIRCSTTRQGQLPPEIRERLGLPPGPANHYRPIFLRTWKDRQDSEERARTRAARKMGVDGGPPVIREGVR